MATTRPAISGANITSRTARSEPIASSVIGTRAGFTTTAVTGTAAAGGCGAGAVRTARHTETTTHRTMNPTSTPHVGLMRDWTGARLRSTRTSDRGLSPLERRRIYPESIDAALLRPRPAPDDP